MPIVFKISVFLVVLELFPQATGTRRDIFGEIKDHALALDGSVVANEEEGRMRLICAKPHKVLPA